LPIFGSVYRNDSDRLKNRAAIKCLLRFTHFLAHQHTPHTTNFSNLVDLVVSCGGENLKYFLEKAGRNISKDAVIDFAEIIGQWEPSEKASSSRVL